ncbi:MAG: PIN domain-containing protein [Acidobacteriota bacterium]|nr:PIN domain-containing protein [Acidobacteriota bacterium]
MPYLADTNVLLRWASPADPQHALAVDSVKELRRRGEIVHITPQNLIELWNVATRPASANGLGMSPVEAERLVESLELLFPLVPDSPDVYKEWRRLVSSAGVSGVKVHDARLAAVMIANGLTHVLTFNTGDFKRFPGITAVHPQDV